MHGNDSRDFRRSVIAAFLVLLFPIAAAGAPPESSPNTEDPGAPVNAVCPVMPDEPVDPRFTVEHGGRVIGLCCRKCLTKFRKDPEAYLASLPVSLDSPAPPGDHQHHHGDDPIDDATQAGVTSPDESPNATGEAPLESAPETTHGESHDHSHAHGAGARNQFLVWLGKFHPPATHLPIGLLLGAAVAELAVIVTKNARYRHVAIFCLTLASIGAAVAATLGWLNAGASIGADDWILAIHRWIGTGTAALTLLTLLLAARVARADVATRRDVVYRVFLFLSTALVGVTGFFGGALIYGIDHYAL